MPFCATLRTLYVPLRHFTLLYATLRYFTVFSDIGSFRYIVIPVPGHLDPKPPMARKDNEMLQSTQESTYKAQCLKWKKNVKSKAVYCEASNHWIHYKCDKLSETEITGSIQLPKSTIYLKALLFTKKH